MIACPIASSLAAYEAELDRQDAYEAAITARQDEILDSLDDLDALDMTQFERIRLMLNMRVITINRKPQSREKAMDEIREVILEASRRTAERIYKEEMDAAAEALAVERWERLMERCEE